MKNLPPTEKIYEAWSALADGRVALGAGEAKVLSSDGAKEYTVRYGLGDEPAEYASNDNATYWRGYAGYPVIAVLMMQGRLPWNLEESNRWGGIDWHALNEKHRRDYGAALKEAEAARGIESAVAAAHAAKVMAALEALPIEVKRLREKPAVRVSQPD